MKYPQEQYKKILEHLPALLKSFGMTVEETQELIDGSLHQLYMHLYIQLTYDASNPNVRNKEGKSLVKVGGERLLPLDTTFKLYPGDNCHDAHIRTVMRAAVRELNNKK